MIALDAEFCAGQRSARRRRERIGFPAVTAETGQHELHHVALAMIRRRRVGEDEQLHAIDCRQG